MKNNSVNTGQEHRGGVPGAESQKTSELNAALSTRKAAVGKVELLRGGEVLGSVQAVTTSGRYTGQWIVYVGEGRDGTSTWMKYRSAQLAMNALVKKIQ